VSDPVATPDELALLLGLTEIDPDRATLLLRLAQSLCESVVSPLPAGAEVVVLGVAARAFTNPAQAQAQMAGPFQVQFSPNAGGLFLSRADKLTLRRLAGTGSAFSIDTLPTGTAEIQMVTVVASAGSYTLTWMNRVSDPLAYNASAGAVQVALDAIVGAGNTAVTNIATGLYQVQFAGVLATTPVPSLIANGAALTGTVAVSVIRPGILAPGQGLPYWDRDYVGGTGQTGGYW